METETKTTMNTGTRTQMKMKMIMKKTDENEDEEREDDDEDEDEDEGGDEDEDEAEAEDGEERQNRCQDDRLCESLDDDRDNDDYRQDIEKSRPRKYIRESNRRDAFGLAVRVVPGAQLREDPAVDRRSNTHELLVHNTRDQVENPRIHDVHLAPRLRQRGGLFLSNLADDHEPRGPVAPVSEGHQILGSIDDVLKLL